MTEQKNKGNTITRGQFIKGGLAAAVTVGAMVTGIPSAWEGGYKTGLKQSRKGLRDLVANIDEFRLDDNCILESSLQGRLDYEEEQDALSTINSASLSGNSSLSIDDISGNSVMLSHIFLPALSVEDLININNGYVSHSIPASGTENIMNVNLGFKWPDRYENNRPKELGRIWYSKIWSYGYLVSNKGHILTNLALDKKSADCCKIVVMDPRTKEVYNVYGPLAYSPRYGIALFRAPDLKKDSITPVNLLPKEALRENMDVYNTRMVVTGDVEYDFSQGIFMIKNKGDITIKSPISKGYYRGQLDVVTNPSGSVMANLSVMEVVSGDNCSEGIITDKHGRIAGFVLGGDGKMAYYASAPKIEGLIGFYLSELKDTHKKRKISPDIVSLA